MRIIRSVSLCVVALMLAFVIGRLSAQDVNPSCKMCPTTYVSADELQAYVKRAMATGAVDQQVRSLDIGKSNVQVAVVHRGKLDKPGARSVAEHDLVSEVYYILSGGGTHLSGPDLVEKVRRPADNNAVRLLNGPGNNAASIRNAATHQLKAGDVFVIPAGTGHQFTRIDDHITYLMVRVDPDKIVPLMDEAASKAYLAGSGREE